jgi:thiosulfate dehydrogenase
VLERNAHHGRLSGLVVMAVLAVPIRATAQATSPGQDAAAIARNGNGHGAPACVTCHGPRLLGNPALASPRIAGQSAPYVAAQLEALASGARKNALMLPVATALSPAEREALATYLSGLPVGPDPAPDTIAATADSATLRAGEVLATRGRWSDDLPACDRCHGPGGVGVGTAFPPLAGQPALYLINQLDAWRRGTRPPGPLDLMSTLAKRMSQADVTAVAAYYALRPPTLAPREGSRP